MKKKLNELFGPYDLPKKPDQSLLTAPFYQRNFNRQKLQLRPMHLALHGRLLHKWCNQPYAARFWQLQGTYKSFKAYYDEMLEASINLFFMLYLDDTPVGFVEVYRVINDEELAQHLDAQNNDYGLHLLMCPYRLLPPSVIKNMKGIAYQSLLTVLDFLFYVLTIDSLYAEPDAANIHACRLAEQAGFDFLETIQLSYKTANLYRYVRKDYEKKHPLKTRK